jgi:chromosome segregation ATPase
MKQLEELQQEQARINTAIGNINTQNAEQKTKIADLEKKIFDLQDNQGISKEDANSLLQGLKDIRVNAESISDVIEVPETGNPGEEA